MTTERISASLSAQDITDIKAAIQTIHSKLPFLLTLTPDERKKLSKLSGANPTFIQAALSAAKQHGEILPSSFKADAFESDAVLSETLSEILPALESISSGIADTHLSLGANISTDADTVFEYAKMAAKMNPAVKAVAEKLNTSLKGQKKEKPAKSPKPPKEPKAPKEPKEAKESKQAEAIV